MTKTTQHASRSLPRRLVVGLSTSIASVGLVIFVVELAFNYSLTTEEKHTIRLVRDSVVRGEVGFFEPRPHISFSRPLDPDRFPEVNSFGYRDRERSFEGTPGTRRVLCLGGSTTESGNSEHFGAFPEQLEVLLNVHTKKPFEVLNCGVSGWTTAETLVAYFLLLQDFQPDLVVIHHAANDSAPRNSLDYEPDYSHFRKTWELPRHSPLERFLVRWSKLYTWQSRHRLDPPSIADVTTVEVPERRAWDGTRLPPETSHSFRRNLLTIAEHVRSRGGQVLLVTMPWNQELESLLVNVLLVGGMRDHNRIMRELAAEHGFLLCDPAMEDPKRWAPHFRDLIHLTKAGNLLKTEAIGRVLVDSWLPTLDEVPNPRLQTPSLPE